MNVELDDLPVGATVIRARLVLAHKVVAKPELSQLCVLLASHPNDPDPMAIQFTSPDAALSFLEHIAAGIKQAWPKGS